MPRYFALPNHPLVWCTRLAAVQNLAEYADNPTSDVSTTNPPKWSAFGKYKRSKCRATLDPQVAAHDEGVYGCTFAISVGGLAAA